MNNMELYEKLRRVPEEAKKPIGAGRLKGFTDINPMWRIKALTETFGPCGIGWWYTITDKRLEGEGNEVRAFVDIELYYRWNGELSAPIPGTGGSSFLTQESRGAYTSDECYKMALTDAISVAAKMLGLGADVYYEKDRDKYTTVEEKPKQASRFEPVKQEEAGPKMADDGNYYCYECKQPVGQVSLTSGQKLTPAEIVSMSWQAYNTQLCFRCAKKRKAA